MPLRWVEALKLWNAHHKTIEPSHVWAVPRKGTAEYQTVRKIMSEGGINGEAAAKPSVRFEPKEEYTREEFAQMSPAERAKATAYMKAASKEATSAKTRAKALEQLRAVEAATKARNVQRKEAAAAPKPAPKPEPRKEVKLSEREEEERKWLKAFDDVDVEGLRGDDYDYFPFPEFKKDKATAKVFGAQKKGGRGSMSIATRDLISKLCPYPISITTKILEGKPEEKAVRAITEWDPPEDDEDAEVPNPFDEVYAITYKIPAASVDKVKKWLNRLDDYAHEYLQDNQE